MTDCTEAQLTIPGFDRRPFEVNFQGGDVTSDAGGCLLLRCNSQYLIWTL
jgi:hypothetical protein